MSEATDSVDSADRRLAVIGWILSFVTLFVGPIVLFFVCGKRKFVRKHAATAATGSLIVTLFFWVTLLWASPVFVMGQRVGVPDPVLFLHSVYAGLFILVALSWFQNQVKGVIAAYRGQDFEPTITMPARRILFNC